MSRMSRRGFMGAAAASSLAMTGRARAIEPIERTGEPRIKISIAAYSMRKYLTAEPGTEGAMDMHGFVSWAAELGFDAVEPTSYFFPEQVTPEYLHDLKRHCHVLGMDISGGAIRSNLTYDPGSSRAQEQLDYIRTWCEHYRALGAVPLRIFAGNPPRGMDEEHAMKNIIENMHRACEIGREHGIMMAPENHDFVTPPDRFARLVESMDTEWFAITLDSANWDAEDPYEPWERFAPYAVNAHVKSTMHPRGKPDEATDFKRLLGLLIDAGYRGYAVLEYEDAEEPYEAVPRYLRELRAAV